MESIKEYSNLNIDDRFVVFLKDNDILAHDSLPQLHKQRQGHIFLMRCFLLSNQRAMNCDAFWITENIYKSPS